MPLSNSLLIFDMHCKISTTNRHKDKATCTFWVQAMGYLTEGHPRNDQALTQSLHVPVSSKKKSI